MGSPTEAEVQTQLQNVIHIFEEARKFASVNASNFRDLQDTYVQSLETEFPFQALQGVNSARSGMNSLLNSDAAAITPVLRAYAKVIDSSSKNRGAQAIIDALYDHFVDNSERITSRQFTFGSPSAAGGNTGNGTIVRLTEDEEGFDLEAQHADAKTAECVRDQNSGVRKHQEVFRFEGGDASPDAIERTGSGAEAEIAARSQRDSIFRNSSFNDLDITNGTIRNWTSSVTIDGTNFAENTTDVYHEAVDANETVKALDLKASLNLTQRLTVGGQPLDRDIPYYAQIAYNASVNTATGTLQIDLGAVSASVSVTGKTGWNTLTLTLDKNLWYKNLKENNLDMKITWTPTSGSGDLIIDDLVVVPMDAFDGSWYTIIGGTTPFLIEDSFSWSDTEVGSIIQFWLWKAFNRYLPHTTGSLVTIADP